MLAKIQKLGNSRRLTIDKPVPKAIAAKKKKVGIEDLAAGMPRNYLPQEAGFGLAKGNEAWN